MCIIYKCRTVCIETLFMYERTLSRLRKARTHSKWLKGLLALCVRSAFNVCAKVITLLMCQHTHTHMSGTIYAKYVSAVIVFILEASCFV